MRSSRLADVDHRAEDRRHAAGRVAEREEVREVEVADHREVARRSAGKPWSCGSARGDRACIIAHRRPACPPARNAVRAEKRPLVTLGGIPTRPPDDRPLALVPRLPPPARTHGHRRHRARLRRRAAGRPLRRLPDDASRSQAVDRAAVVGHHAVRHRAAVRPRACPSTASAPRCAGGRATTSCCRRRSGASMRRAPAGVQRSRRLRSAACRSRAASTTAATARCARSSSRCCGSAWRRIDIALIHDVDPWTHGAGGRRRRFAEALDGALSGARRAALRRRDPRDRRRRQRCGGLRALRARGRHRLRHARRPLHAARAGGARRVPAARHATRGIGVMLGGVFNSGILATGRVSGRAVQLPRPRRPTCSERVRAHRAGVRAHGVRAAARRDRSSRSATPPCRRWCSGRSRPTRWPATSRCSRARCRRRCGATSSPRACCAPTRRLPR